jgi:hypothetical protein
MPDQIRVMGLDAGRMDIRGQHTLRMRRHTEDAKR